MKAGTDGDICRAMMDSPEMTHYVISPADTAKKRLILQCFNLNELTN